MAVQNHIERSNPQRKGTSKDAAPFYHRVKSLGAVGELELGLITKGTYKYCCCIYVYWPVSAIDLLLAVRGL